MSAVHSEHWQVLAEACAQAGLNDAGARMIRIGENSRRTGTARPPRSRLPCGGYTTCRYPIEFALAPLAPFTRLAQRIAAATLSTTDRSWLREHLTELQHRYTTLPEGIPLRVIHGDAWIGNVVTTDDGQTVLLDLERCSFGPPEWDLVSTAIKHTSFAWVSTEDYQHFCGRYGHDVTTWPGFELLRDIRELRMTCYLAQHAAEHPHARSEAELRVACLRGKHGPRPWNWTPAL